MNITVFIKFFLTSFCICYRNSAIYSFIRLVICESIIYIHIYVCRYIYSAKEMISFHLLIFISTSNTICLVLHALTFYKSLCIYCFTVAKICMWTDVHAHMYLYIIHTNIFHMCVYFYRIPCSKIFRTLFENTSPLGAAQKRDR